jgi:predicted permease
MRDWEYFFDGVLDRYSRLVDVAWGVLCVFVGGCLTCWWLFRLFVDELFRRRE